MDSAELWGPIVREEPLLGSMQWHHRILWYSLSVHNI